MHRGPDPDDRKVRVNPHPRPVLCFAFPRLLKGPVDHLLDPLLFQVTPMAGMLLRQQDLNDSAVHLLLYQTIYLVRYNLFRQCLICRFIPHSFFRICLGVHSAIPDLRSCRSCAFLHRRSLTVSLRIRLVIPLRTCRFPVSLYAIIFRVRILNQESHRLANRFCGVFSVQIDVSFQNHHVCRGQPAAHDHTFRLQPFRPRLVYTLSGSIRKILQNQRAVPQRFADADFLRCIPVPKLRIVQDVVLQDKKFMQHPRVPFPGFRQQLKPPDDSLLLLRKHHGQR